MKQLRACWRLCRVTVHVLVGAWTIRFNFSHLSQAEKNAAVQVWARAMLARLAIKLVVEGQPPETGPVLLAANHISWLDIVVMHAARHCRFISKADVQHWPIVGILATGAGTLYIERESRRDAMRVVHHMAERLQAGDILAVFPEGTTGDGVALLPFHANLLQAAISAHAPIHPVALHFMDGVTGAQSFAPCYVGADTLLGSLWRTLCTQDLVAVVRFGDPQSAEGRDRRAWAADLHETITQMRAQA
ncbi:lysophospholipid acyltransferase family protein [Rhodoferax saidenbachensis]|uniref:1-acyl-sn-glycerol-3-phosphate acyltransferase n=1 Tax=Rhodoferax saidenbachensis TaxID=1484693 RepID=A0A1P8KDM8_9BURK|nr:lysophospholipid acyltransferase family protein [Rhodoferax saidenbachensis]APW44028.1 1-acyl-sn-glycerol-3-phosphate acyltransferase [Rhodoferax saidenbachensis]